MTPPRALPLLLAACACALVLGATAARAQGTPAGRVTGRVTSGTAGETVPDGLTVRLIALEDSRVVETVETTVRDGRFELSAPANPARTYVPHLVYQKVDYLALPVTFRDGAIEAQRDFLVYATTHDMPPLTITSTVVTVVAIDRQQRQLGLVREDSIANPSDRVFVGDEAGVTLRIPAPDGTIDAAGENQNGTFTFERGVVTTTVPIRPGVLTSIVTRYLVGYDAAADRYRLSVTAPLPVERMAVRVPAGYARALAPVAGARRTADERLTGDPEGQVLKVAQSTAAVQPGGGMIVDLLGVSGRERSNPLTTRRGAAIATAIALVIACGGTAAAWRWRGAAA